MIRSVSNFLNNIRGAFTGVYRITNKEGKSYTITYLSVEEYNKRAVALFNKRVRESDLKYRQLQKDRIDNKKDLPLTDAQKIFQGKFARKP